MSEKSRARMEAREAIVKALAHTTRLLVVEELGRGELCVGDLQALAKCDLSTMSKHLAILKGAGVVRTRKAGTTVYYRLALSCAGDFFKCVDAMVAHNARRHAEVLR